MANLLIVDDEETLLSALQRILSNTGHEVRAMTSGEAALDAIRGNPPDLVVSDVLMPDMTGPQLLEIVRAHPKWNYIPFLFVSASISLKTEGRIAALDNTYYLRKPFEIEELLDTVDRILEAPDRQRDEKYRGKSGQEAPSELSRNLL
jgi:CheY-like chemotaxis protein